MKSRDDTQKMTIRHAAELTFQRWRHLAHACSVGTKLSGRKDPTPSFGCLNTTPTPTPTQHFRRDFPRRFPVCGHGLCGQRRRGRAGAARAPAGSGGDASVPIAPRRSHEKPPRRALLCRALVAAPPPPRAPAARPAPLRPEEMRENTKSSRKSSHRGCPSHPPARRAAAARRREQPARMRLLFPRR